MIAPSTAGLDAAIATAATLIEFVGAIFVVANAFRAVASLYSSRGSADGVTRSRLALADGVIAALGFKTAATLLKTMELRSWNAIALFAAVLALRTFVKQGLAWESVRLRSTLDRSPES